MSLYYPAGFAFPGFDVLLPSGSQSRKLHDQSRHDIRLNWSVVLVENPVRFVPPYSPLMIAAPNQAFHSLRIKNDPGPMSVLAIFQQLTFNPSRTKRDKAKLPNDLSVGSSLSRLNAANFTSTLKYGHWR